MSESTSLRVAVDTPAHTAIGEPLTYLGDPALPAGTLVRVPLGRREVTGIVWSASDAPEPDGAVELKQVLHALTSLPPLPQRWLELVAFTAAYYQRGIGEVALSVLPPELRKLDDAQVLEAQLAENGDREDVHPLDEAEGYRDLVEKHGANVETIGQHLGLYTCAELPTQPTLVVGDKTLDPPAAATEATLAAADAPAAGGCQAGARPQVMWPLLLAFLLLRLRRTATKLNVRP